MEKDAPNFLCESCNAEFTKRRNLTRHHRIFHQEHRVLYVCDTCGRAFSRLDSLKRHEKTQHTPEVHVDQEEQRMVCSECNLQFMEEKHLEDHKSTHHPKETFLCHSCGRVYNQRDKFIKHVSSHRRHNPLTSGSKRKSNTAGQSPKQTKSK